MAITARSSAFNSISTLGSASAALVIAAPAGLAAGDVLVATVDWMHSGGAAAQGTCTPPEGWVSIRKTEGGGSVRRVKQSFYKVAGGAEPASYTFTVAGAGAATGIDAAGGIAAFIGVDNSAPINVHAGETIAVSTTAFVAPSVTTTVGKCLILFAAGSHNAARTFTPPESALEAYDAAASTVASAAAYDKATVAQGATGARTLTASATAVGATQTIALAPAPVRGKGVGEGLGGGTAKGKRKRRGRGVGTGVGGGVAAGTVTPKRNRLRVRETVPMRQTLICTAPNGTVYRWAEDAEAGRVFTDLSDSGSVPGGDKDLTATLPRKDGVDYGDMRRGSVIEIFGAGFQALSAFRLERAPVITGESVALAPAAPGIEADLARDNTAQEIFLDADLSGWGEPSARRRATFGSKDKVNQNAQVSLVPAGTPDPDNPSSYAQVPAISHSWSSYQSGGGRDTAESWYDGGGVPLGRALGDFLSVRGLGGDSTWSNLVTAAESDLGGNEGKPFETLADFDAISTAHFDLAVAPSRFFLSLEDFYSAEKNELGAWETQWRNVRAMGRHGLPLRGVWPRVGLLASDVVAYILGRWAPHIRFSTGRFGTIKPTRFLIPHLTFKEPTSPAEMIQQATRFELPEFGVWAGPEGPTFYMNPRGQREGSKTWRVRSSEIEYEDTGQQLDKVFNGVLVMGQGTDGSTISIGPSGSGLRHTSDRLLDLDPQNAANEAGIRQYAKIQMKGIATLEGMIEAGEAFLEQCKLLDGSGKATLTGYVEDEHGQRWPYYYVKEGHRIEILGSSIPGPRYIVGSARGRSSRSVSIDIDAPPDSYEAMMERLYAEFLGIAMAGG